MDLPKLIPKFQDMYYSKTKIAKPDNWEIEYIVWMMNVALPYNVKELTEQQLHDLKISFQKCIQDNVAPHTRDGLPTLTVRRFLEIYVGSHHTIADIKAFRDQCSATAFNAFIHDFHKGKQNDAAASTTVTMTAATTTNEEEQ